MDGIEAVRIIREELGAESEYARTIPIIALTANAIFGNEALFLQQGFQAFLTKPIDIMQMDAAINRWVRDKKMEKEIDLKTPENKNIESIGMTNPSDQLDPSIEALIKAGAHIKGLDIRSSLKRINWDTETWIKMVHVFIRTTPGLLEILKDKTKENLSKFAITVHGMKSVCYSFGALNAGDKAKELEKHSRAGDLSFVQENTDSFVRMIEEFLKGLEELLEAITVKIEKPLKERPDPEVLAKILKAAESYNLRNLEEGIAALDEYSYQEEQELILWLKEQCKALEFAAIQERVAKKLEPLKT
jgi:CheY-like chemotaxis protein